MLNPEGSLHGGCAAFLIDAYVIIISPPPSLFTPHFLFFVLWRPTHTHEGRLQMHDARVPRRLALRWCLGDHEHRLPRPRSPVRKKKLLCSTWILTNSISGAKLRIVNSGIAMGSRIMSARSEVRFTFLFGEISFACALSSHIVVVTFQIWDETTKRLCVTGVHIKMEPSLPKVKQKL
jgi:hypothetical protein